MKTQYITSNLSSNSHNVLMTALDEIVKLKRLLAQSTDLTEHAYFDLLDDSDRHAIGSTTRGLKEQLAILEAISDRLQLLPLDFEFSYLYKASDWSHMTLTDFKALYALIEGEKQAVQSNVYSWRGEEETAEYIIDVKARLAYMQNLSNQILTALTIRGGIEAQCDFIHCLDLKQVIL